MEIKPPLLTDYFILKSLGNLRLKFEILTPIYLWLIICVFLYHILKYRGVTLSKTEVNQMQKLGKLVETGDKLRKSKEWKKALEVYRSGLRLATKLKQTEYRGIFLRKIAAIQINQGIINNAMVNLEKALALFHSIESKRNLAITYLDIGAAYLERGDHIKALEYLDKAQTLATSINDNICLAAILNNRGLALIYETKFEESKSILTESLRLYKELGLKGDEG